MNELYPEEGEQAVDIAGDGYQPPLRNGGPWGRSQSQECREAVAQEGIRLTRDSWKTTIVTESAGKPVPGGSGFKSLKPLCYRVSRLKWIPAQDTQTSRLQAIFYTNQYVVYEGVVPTAQREPLPKTRQQTIRALRPHLAAAGVISGPLSAAIFQETLPSYRRYQGVHDIDIPTYRIAG